MKEITFNGEIVNSIKRNGWWAYKIPDFPRFKGAGLRFNAPRPFDIVACIDGKMVAIEGKQFKKMQALGRQCFREYQVDTLDDVSKHARTFVFLNIRQRADKEKGLKRENRLYIFEWNAITDRIKKRNSIMKKEIELLPFYMGSHGGFGLQGFCDCIIKGYKWTGKFPH